MTDLAHPDSGGRDRLRELARQAANRQHDCYFYAHDANGHVFDTADGFWGFTTCPHPDCVLVREPLPTDQPADADGRFMLNAYGRRCFELGQSAAVQEIPIARPPEPLRTSYDFTYEAQRVCEAIGSEVGRMTVMCALREAYEAGAAIPSSPSAPDRQLVWLIERIQPMQINGRATYWTGWTGDDRKNLPDVETNNPWDAIWFARKQDAMRAALHQFGSPLARSGWQIVEHLFAGAASSSSAEPEKPK